MNKPIYEFGNFRFDSAHRTLLCEGQPIPLTPKNQETLAVFLEKHERVLEKEELMNLLWPDSVVEENNLTQNISALRKALGEKPNEQRFIKTIPGRGYRFVAEVRELPADVEGLIVQQSKVSVVIEEENEEEASGSEAVVATVPGTFLRSRTAVISALGLFVLLGVGAAYWWKGRESSPRAPNFAIKTLAVLPFKSLNPQPGKNSNDEYLGVGLADVMITRLSNLSQLAVRPTSSVLPFGNQDALLAGQALKVDSVLDGSIQQIGDRVRVTVRLLRTSDGQPLWAFQCDEKCTDIFALQDTVSARLTDALELKLSGDERKRLTRRYTENAAAYQEYLKGRFYTLQYSPDGFKKAVEHLNEAIRLDPTYALAWAGLADAYTAGSDWLLAPREALSKAKAAAGKALALDDTLAEAHAALGHAQLHRQEPEAERELQRALELNPNSVTTLLWYGEYFLGKDYDKGLVVLQRARQLDSLSPVIGSFTAFHHLWFRHLDAALKEAQKTVELDPNAPFARGILLMALDANRKYAEVIAGCEQMKQQQTLIPQGLGGLGRAYAMAGRLNEARQTLAEMKQLAGQEYVSPYDIAVVYAALGDKDQAFAYLEKAREDQAEFLGWLKDDYRMDGLHSDSRFADLLQRVGPTQ